VFYRVASAWSDGVYHLYVRVLPVGNSTYTANGVNSHNLHVCGMKLYQISCTVCIFHFLFVYAFNCIVIFEGSRCVYLFAFYTIFLLFWKMLVFSGTFFCLLM